MSILKTLMRGSAAETDPNFKNTVLLIHGDGTNGAQNNTFVDGSSNNFTITRNGNATQGSFSPFGDRWSAYFDGTGDYLSVADSTGFTLSSGDWTIEFWFNYGTVNATQFIAAQSDGNSTNTSFDAYIDTASGILSARLFCTDLSNVSVAKTGLSSGRWYHAALVKDGTTARLYVDGVEAGNGSLSGKTINDSSATFNVGTKSGSSNHSGYISNFRLVKGTCLYPSGTTFTPSTTPLTAVTNTQLLCCHTNRFIDGSSNAFTITRNGDTKVTKFSPFAPTAAYSTATDGGSGYFDGSGDYLQTPAADGASYLNGTGDFTIEWFAYTTANSDANGWVPYGQDGAAAVYCPLVIRCYSTSNWQFFASTASSSWDIANGVSLASSATPPLNQWAHFAIVRSGTNLKLYIDGVAQGAGATLSGSIHSNTSLKLSLFNGFQQTAGSGLVGYISNYRILKGTALYTTAFTPPTAPLTAITNTQLLCNFTNAAIYDQTGNNVLETVGNAQVSTTSPKYGTGSILFDETGDYLTLPINQWPTLGTRDFTIECFVNFASSTVGNGQGVFQLSSGYLNSVTRGPAVGTDNTTGRWAYYYGTSSAVHGSSAPSTNTWYHVAFVRNSGVSKLYVDGTEILSAADTTNYTDTYFVIGGYYSSSFLLNGKIDEFRITHGVARYTANFTPSTTAFPDQ